MFQHGLLGCLLYLTEDSFRTHPKFCRAYVLGSSRPKLGHTRCSQAIALKTHWIPGLPTLPYGERSTTPAEFLLRTPPVRGRHVARSPGTAKPRAPPFGKFSS